MAVAFVSAGTLGAAASGTSITPALPASMALGNLMIGIVGTKNNATHTWPAGWTKVAQTNSGTLWTVSWAWRIFRTGDAAPAVTWSGSVANTGQLIRYTGADQFMPIGALGTVGTGTVSPHTSAAITTTRNASLAIYLDSCAVNTALTTPAGYTGDLDNGSATSATRISEGSQTVATAGTATSAISTAGGAAAWVEQQVELLAPMPPPGARHESSDGQKGLTPHAARAGAPRLANYTSLNIPHFPNVLMPGNVDWPITPPPPPIQQTVVWRQTHMIGKDKLPVGDQVTDLTGRPYRPEFTWALNLQLTTLAPANNLPFNQYDWPLPKINNRIEQTWVWNQTPMLGQDKLPVGEQVYDLWVRAAKPIDQTWIWRQVHMLGQDQLPVGEQVWELTPRPAPRLSLYSWEWRQTGMLGQDVLPFNQYDWPLPIRPLRFDQTWTLNLQQTTLQPNLQFPFNQYDWPVPRAPFRMEQTWTLGLNTTTLVPTFNQPFNQYDWPLPKAPLRIDETWVWNNTIMIGQDILPHNQYDWPVPRAPYRIEQTTTWRQTHMLGQDVLPTGKQVYDLPVRAPRPIEQTWTWRQTGMLGKDVMIAGDQVFDLPTRLPTPVYGWAWRQVHMLGQDRLPVGKQFTELTVKPPFRPMDFYTWVSSNPQLYSIAPPQFISGSSDWPLIPGADQFVRSWEWNNTRFIPLPASIPRSIARQFFDLPPRGVFQPDRGFTYRSQFIPGFVPPVFIGASYFLLQPHYVNDVLIPAWTVVTEGLEIPIGWVPTLMVDPLNDQAVAAFYAAGPRLGYPGPNYDWQGTQFLTSHRPSAIQSGNTHWVQLSPGMYKLTGLGASLPPIGV